MGDIEYNLYYYIDDYIDSHNITCITIDFWGTLISDDIVKLKTIKKNIGIIKKETKKDLYSLSNVSSI